jgi:hypothetical protein
MVRVVLFDSPALEPAVAVQDSGSAVLGTSV